MELTVLTMAVSLVGLVVARLVIKEMVATLVQMARVVEEEGDTIILLPMVIPLVVELA
jgi:hypothetical protein